MDNEATPTLNRINVRKLEYMYPTCVPVQRAWVCDCGARVRGPENVDKCLRPFVTVYFYFVTVTFNPFLYFYVFFFSIYIYTHIYIEREMEKEEIFRFVEFRL